MKNVTPAAWNRLVDGFDVEGLAAQIAELQAGYFFLTLGQNSGYWLSPNATYDELVGRQPSRLSSRDLVADLSAALGKVGVPLLVYCPACAPNRDQLAVRKLRCTPPWDAARLGFPPESMFPEDAARTDERLTEFQQNWATRPSSASGACAGARACAAGGSTAATRPTACTATPTRPTSPLSPRR